MLFFHVFPFFFPILVLLLFFFLPFFSLFFVNFILFYFFLDSDFFSSFELSITRVSSHHTHPPPSSGLGTSKISLACTDLSWRSCGYMHIPGNLNAKLTLLDPSFTEETRLYCIICNFLDVDGVVA